MNKQTRAVLYLISFALMSFAAACQATPMTTVPTPLPTLSNSRIIENEGVVCFNEYANSSEVDGYFRPRGCFSSSCWQLVEKSLIVRVVEDQQQLRFYSRVTVKDFSMINGEHVACTADCSNVGEIQFSLSNVPRQKYSVWLGNQRMGEFANTPKEVTTSTSCFGQEY